MDLKRFIASGLVASTLGTTMNIAQATPLISPEVENYQKSMSRLVNGDNEVAKHLSESSFNARLNAVTKTLDNSVQQNFTTEIKEVMDSQQISLQQAINQNYKHYYNQGYGEGAYETNLQVSSISQQADVLEAISESSFRENTNVIKAVKEQVASDLDSAGVSLIPQAVMRESFNNINAQNLSPNLFSQALNNESQKISNNEISEYKNESVAKNNTVLNAVAKTLPGVYKDDFLDKSKLGVYNSGSVDATVNEMYPSYLKNVYGNDSYQYLLKKSGLDENTSPMYALAQDEFQKNVAELRDVFGKITEVLPGSNIVNDMVAKYQIESLIKDDMNGGKNVMANFETLIEDNKKFKEVADNIGGWKDNPSLQTVRTNLLSAGVDSSTIIKAEQYMESRTDIVHQNMLARYNREEVLFKNSQLGVLSGQKDIIDMIQVYGEYNNTVKKAGKEPVSPEMFFESPFFKNYESEVKMSEKYLLNNGTSPESVKSDSIVMVHNEMMNQKSALSLQGLDKDVLKGQLEKYKHYYADVNSGNTDLYAHQKAINPTLDVNEVVERGSKVSEKFQNMSDFQKLKFTITNAVMFGATEPKLTAQFVGSLFSGSEAEKASVQQDFKMKAKMFLTDKLNNLLEEDNKVQERVTVQASIQGNESVDSTNPIVEKISELAKDGKKNFDSFMSKAQNFFDNNDDKEMQASCSKPSSNKM